MQPARRIVRSEGRLRSLRRQGSSMAAFTPSRRASTSSASSGPASPVGRCTIERRNSGYVDRARTGLSATPHVNLAAFQELDRRVPRRGHRQALDRASTRSRLPVEGCRAASQARYARRGRSVAVDRSAASVARALLAGRSTYRCNGTTDVGLELNPRKTRSRPKWLGQFGHGKGFPQQHGCDGDDRIPHRVLAPVRTISLALGPRPRVHARR